MSKKIDKKREQQLKQLEATARGIWGCLAFFGFITFVILMMPIIIPVTGFFFDLIGKGGFLPCVGYFGVMLIGAGFITIIGFALELLA